MKRLPFISVLALALLSACDGGTLVSPMAPEIQAPSFQKAELPEFEPPAACPVASCVLEPTIITRGKKAPSKVVLEFSADADQAAELVVLTSDPKRTTVKAWLNGAAVLLPSAIPQSGSDEVRVPVTLAEENLFEIRVSAKPGTEIAFWIEGEAVTPPEPEDPVPTMVFEVTSAVVAPTADMNAACVAEFGADFGIADWTQVVEAVAAGETKDEILASGMAMILNSGTGSFLPPFSWTWNHYMISAIGADGSTIASVGQDMFWLTSSTFNQPVLCVDPSA